MIKGEGIIDENIKSLTKKLLSMEYSYKDMLDKRAIRKRLKEYLKVKEEKRKEINEAEYFMISGYINALEWVLNEKEDKDIPQLQSQYDIQHSLR